MLYAKRVIGLIDRGVVGYANAPSADQLGGAHDEPGDDSCEP